eukprot:TRINITY_DN5002_c0_g1_i1.p1 TRINITY_DN5002_c0_g1~~TRINITY_DN5002_c0_g1_i1.p1  ORF type:complete len:663 (-),score=172.85 TRINITY_DN5002_c0_g1_i1:698-2686(-)
MSQAPCSDFDPQLYRKTHCKNCYRLEKDHGINKTTNDSTIEVPKASSQTQFKMLKVDKSDSGPRSAPVPKTAPPAVPKKVFRPPPPTQPREINKVPIAPVVTPVSPVPVAVNRRLEASNHIGKLSFDSAASGTSKSADFTGTTKPKSGSVSVSESEISPRHKGSRAPVRESDHVTFCWQLVRDVFELMGLDEQRQSELLKSLKAKSALVGPPTLHSLHVVDKIEAKCAEYKHVHKSVLSAVRIQAWCRTYLARSQYLNLKTDPISRERHELVKSLLNEERGYWLKLETIIQDYMNPLKGASGSRIIPFLRKTGISSSDLETIFANITEIAEVHKEMKSEIERVLSELTVETAHVGQLFLKMAPKMKVYGRYVNNFVWSNMTLSRVTAESAAHQLELEQLQSESRMPELPLVTLLTCPLNHITMYRLKLEELERIESKKRGKGTSEELTKALTVMTETSAFIHDSVLHSQERAQMMELQRNFTFERDSFELWNGKRELEWQGEVSSVDKSSKKSGKSIYVFTDLCLYGSLKQKKFYVKHVIPLNELTLTPDPVEAQVELSFKKTKLVVAFERVADRNKFVELTRDLSTPLKKKTMVLGLSVLDMMEEEAPHLAATAGVPYLVYKCVEHLRKSKSHDHIRQVTHPRAQISTRKDCSASPPRAVN